MDYKDLLERYREGNVSKEEEEMIRKDIEKAQAIEAFMGEELERELDLSLEVADSENYEEETIKLKKSVNKRLRKVVLSSVLLVVALYITIFYGISPLVDSLYYNPMKTSVGQSDHDISFDVYAITELNKPGLSPSTVYVDQEGFGKYNVMYSYRDVFTDENYDVNQVLQRGEIENSYSDPISQSSMFMGIMYPSNDNDAAVSKEKVMNHLMQLNPITYVSMSILFEKDLSMEELYRLEESYPEIEFEWAGIRTESSDQSKELIGISLLSSKVSSPLLGDEKISEKYPAFFMMDWLVHPMNRKEDTSLIAQAYEEHYRSLLQYVIERKDAIGVMEYREEKTDFYEAALDYADNQGIETYGVLVYGEAEDLLLLVEDESVRSLEFHQASVSRKNIK